jgi:hypothetical protein
MVIYKCKRCGYETRQKTHLKNHLHKKKECECIYENIDREILLTELEQKIKKDPNLNCINCGELFNSRQTKWRHEKKCEIKKNDKKNIIEELKELKESNKELKESNKELIESNKHTENILNKLIECHLLNQINSNNTTINNNTTNNNMTVTNNFIIENLRPFGKENYNYVTDEMLYGMYKDEDVWLYDFIRRVHFNDNHPENWNIYINTMTDDKVNVYNGVKYELLDRASTLMRLVKNKRSYLENYLISLYEQIKMDLDAPLDIILPSSPRYKDSNDYIPSFKENDEIKEEMRKKLTLIENMQQELNEFDNGEDYECYTNKVLKRSENLAYNDNKKIIGLRDDLERTNKSMINNIIVKK